MNSAIIINPYKNDKFERLSEDIIIQIFEFVGKESYFGFGATNRRFNQIFNLNDVPKKSSCGGYMPLKSMVKKFDKGHEFGDEYQMFQDVCSHIAVGVVYFSRKDLLQWSLGNQNPRLLEEICCKAVKAGRMEFLKNMFSGFSKELMNHMRKSEWLCLDAAENGRLKILRFLHEHRIDWDSNVCSEAASNGHLECLKYLHTHGCEWNTSACRKAASNGYLEVLIFLHDHDCEWDHWAFDEAARNGHLNCIQYLYENGCESFSEACDGAAINCHFNCLRYLREIGMQWKHYDKYLQ